MSMSIYYTARRSRPLIDVEKRAVREAVKRYAVDDQLLERMRSGEGPNWESFCVYDPTHPSEPDVIFEGATKIPDNSEEASWAGLQRWCGALTEIRRSLPDATWSVHVEDHEIAWDEELQTFDPSA